MREVPLCREFPQQNRSGPGHLQPRCRTVAGTMMAHELRVRARRTCGRVLGAAGYSRLNLAGRICSSRCHTLGLTLRSAGRSQGLTVTGVGSIRNRPAWTGTNFPHSRLAPVLAILTCLLGPAHANPAVAAPDRPEVFTPEYWAQQIESLGHKPKAEGQIWWDEIRRDLPQCNQYTDGCRICPGGATCTSIPTACTPFEWRCYRGKLD